MQTLISTNAGAQEALEAIRRYAQDRASSTESLNDSVLWTEVSEQVVRLARAVLILNALEETTFDLAVPPSCGICREMLERSNLVRVSDRGLFEHVTCRERLNRLITGRD